jgi:hypothetical protein
MRFLLIFVIFPAAAFAADFTLLSGDRVLSRQEVVALTDTHLIEFYEGGQSRYSAGGSYSYTYLSGGTAFGRFVRRSQPVDATHSANFSAGV